MASQVVLEMLGKELAQHVEPREVLHGLLYALSALHQNEDMVAYMQQSITANTHARADFWDVADELKINATIT
jgi:hypothetical protein